MNQDKAFWNILWNNHFDLVDSALQMLKTAVLRFML